MHRHHKNNLAGYGVISLWALAPAMGWAESFEAGGVTLHEETVLYVDAVQGEILLWRGSGGSVSFQAPSVGRFVGWSPNVPYTVPETATWKVILPEEQSGSWSMTVYSTDNVAQTGRVYSDRWIVSAERSGDGFSESFYLPAPVDTPASVSAATGLLMKLRVEGLYGEKMEIMANTTGVPGTAPQSGPFSSADTEPSSELRLYLENFGALWAGWPTAPTDAWSVRFDHPTCEAVLLEEQGVTLAFDSTLHGYAELICDLSGDAAYDPTGGDADLIGAFVESPASLSWSWWGEDLRTAGGKALVEPGSYSCQGGVHLSPVHALVAHADVADPGVRLFVVDTSTSLALFWDDHLLTDDVLLADGSKADLQSGAGVQSGHPDVLGQANDTAHGWGNVSKDESRGSWGWIDTWAAGRFYAYGRQEVSVYAPEGDEDGDGLISREECGIGTDPGLSDSDGGGTDDGQEIRDGTDPTDPSDDLRASRDDTAVPDTAAPDTADYSSNSGDNSLVLGDFSGGGWGCQATPPLSGARWLLLPLVALARRQRRDRRSGAGRSGQ